MPPPTARLRANFARVLTLAAACALAALLASCGQPSGGGNSGQGAPSVTGTATSRTVGSLGFTCTTATGVAGSDTVEITLRCDVSGARPSETAFAAQYTVAGSTGTRVFSPACSGKLSGGRGSCVAHYTTPVALALGAAHVSGATSPSNQRLGPTTPTPVAATPVGTPITPLATFTIQA